MTWLEHLFPRLRGTGYRVVAPPDPAYNCIAWAVGVADAWWWPSGDPEQAHWPTSAPRDETLKAMQTMFEGLGYRVCDSEDFEPGFEKDAIFATAGHVPTHVARQLPDDRWTSKLGQLECIEHALRDVEGPEYGTVALVMKRPQPS